MAYYTDILNQIEALIKSKAYKDAELLVNEELHMPYIPPDVLLKLKAFQNEIAFNTKASRPKSLDVETLRSFLSLDIDHQESSVYALNELNLRAHSELVQTALTQISDHYLIKLIIHICIKQALTESFQVDIDQVHYTFIPASLTPFTDSQGYLRAKDLLNKYLQDDNPSMLELCLQQLEYQSVLYYPLSYDEEEGESLAYSCLKSIYLRLSDENEFNQFCKKKGIKETIQFSTL